MNPILAPLAQEYERQTCLSPTHFLPQEDRDKWVAQILDLDHHMGSRALLDSYRSFLPGNYSAHIYYWTKPLLARIRKDLPPCADPSYSPPEYDLCVICSSSGASFDASLDALVCGSDICRARVA